MIKEAKRKKILLIGGEGFVGRNIADCLSFKYDCYSVGIEKSFFDGGGSIFIKLDPYKEKIENDYDIIIHLIDNKTNGESFREEEYRLIDNLKLSKKNHLILFSSAVVYANPDSDYGKRKKALEEIYKEYCDKNSIRLTIFRLFNIYGPFQLPFRQGSLIANLLHNHIIGVKTEINDMEATRDFIYSGDIGKFIDYSIECDIFGIQDLATNKPISIGEVIKKIENVAGTRIDIVDKNIKEGIVCPRANSKLVAMIGLTSMEGGLRNTFNFYNRNINLIKKLSE